MSAGTADRSSSAERSEATRWRPLPPRRRHVFSSVRLSAPQFVFEPPRMDLVDRDEIWTYDKNCVCRIK